MRTSPTCLRRPTAPPRRGGALLCLLLAACGEPDAGPEAPGRDAGRDLPAPSEPFAAPARPPATARDGGSARTPAPRPTTPPPAPSAPVAGAAGCDVTRPGASGKEPDGLVPVCCTPGPSDQALVDEVLRLLNAHRAAAGVAPVALDPALTRAMQGHCQHMASHGFFSHGAPEADVASFVKRAAFCGGRAAGENIAAGQRSAAEVMSSWKGSPGHNANMLSARHGRVGIGHVNGRWGQIFGP